ncbi:MAG TPA: hypothetical protein VFJ19_13165, partial [Nocardioidaceae bacterium]|nr:hypothetical protein [Nocardioidaceae bacterium]
MGATALLIAAPTVSASAATVGGTVSVHDRAQAAWGEMAYDSSVYLPTQQDDETDSTAPVGGGAHFMYLGSASDEVQLYRSTALDGKTLSQVSSLSYSTFATA